MSEPVPSVRRDRRAARRTVLLAGAGLGLTALAGCGIRLEDDAPDLPLVPRRTPIPAEQALLDLLANTRTLTTVTGAWTEGLGATLGVALTSIHRTQADVLAAILLAADVPEAQVSPTPTPAGTGSGTATTPSASSTTAPVSASDVAALEREPLADAGTLAGVAGVMRPTVAATLAQRYAATVLAGGRTPTLGRTGDTAATTGTATATGTASGPATGSPSPSTPAGAPEASQWPATSANAVVEATRSAVYGLQVVTARSEGAQRALGQATLAQLGPLAAEQTARLTTTPPTVLGYDLPFPVTSPATARRLALHVLTSLRAAYGAQLPTTQTVGEQVFLDLAEWLGRLEVLLRRWGGTLVPFPGMTA